MNRHEVVWIFAVPDFSKDAIAPHRKGRAGSVTVRPELFLAVLEERLKNLSLSA
jgi:hypothetical protein